MGAVSDLGLDERVDQRPELDHGDGDHDRFAHIIRKSDHMRAYVEGKEVQALCGKRWVPTRDPDRFPLCPDCAAAYNARVFGSDGGSSGGGERR